VREGGAILLVAGCEEGLGSDDYAGLLRGGESPAALMHWIHHTQEPRYDQWQVQCQAMVQAKAEVYLHSLMSPEDTRTALVSYAEDVESTLERLLAEARSRGREGTLLVMPYGQLTVPVVHPSP
jgi:nickel-dependent lactate racemase